MKGVKQQCYIVRYEPLFVDAEPVKRKSLTYAYVG